MLILTRKIGETLKIGDDIDVTVLGVSGNQVRLGTSAPDHVSVHREEIYQRIQQERSQPTSNQTQLYPSQSNEARRKAQRAF